MIFHPIIIALYVSSVLITFMVLYACFYGIQILRSWDIGSGSELQLILERKTYLISTLLIYAFGCELLSLFLYVFTADHLHTFFTGAMCAAGSLYANGYGYPALVVKIINFLFAGLWLILNYADNRGYDYPLIKKKYRLLLVLAPLVVTETILQANYFLRLQPNIITSCCGSLFSTEGTGVMSEILLLPEIPMTVGFYCTLLVFALCGVSYVLRGKGACLFASASALAFLVSILSVITCISVYFYELPTHHCPFCILQREYGYIGYPLYLALFGGTIAGIGVGALAPFRRIPSLAEIIPPLQQKLALASLVLFFIFGAVVTHRILVSGLTLRG